MAHITPAAKSRHRNSKTIYLLSYNNDLSMNPVLQPSILLKPEPNPSSNHNVMYYLKSSTQQNPVTMVSPNAVFIQEPSFSAMPVEETIGKPIFAPGYKNPFDYSKYANYLELSKDLNIRPRCGENRRLRALPPVQHRIWDCVICSKKEKDKDSLMNHYEQHKREKDKLKNCTVSEEKDSAKLEPHTSDTLTDPKEGVDDISTFCKVQFNDVPIQNNQIDSRGNAHECQACKATFANEKAMSRHVCSAKLLECLCSVCGKKFKNQLTLKSHMTIHNGERGYVCNVCGKSFRTSSLFRSHLRVHSGEKPYKCKTCGKCFTQRTSLVIHQRGHTGERPYPCEKCGKGYVSRSALNVHSKNCR